MISPVPAGAIPSRVGFEPETGSEAAGVSESTVSTSASRVESVGTAKGGVVETDSVEPDLATGGASAIRDGGGGATVADCFISEFISDSGSGVCQSEYKILFDGDIADCPQLLSANRKGRLPPIAIIMTGEASTGKTEQIPSRFTPLSPNDWVTQIEADLARANKVALTELYCPFHNPSATAELPEQLHLDCYLVGE
jgi:hypothetical protein